MIWTSFVTIIAISKVTLVLISPKSYGINHLYPAVQIKTVFSSGLPPSLIEFESHIWKYTLKKPLYLCEIYSADEENMTWILIFWPYMTCEQVSKARIIFWHNLWQSSCQVIYANRQVSISSVSRILQSGDWLQVRYGIIRSDIFEQECHNCVYHRGLVKKFSHGKDKRTEVQ